MRISTGKAIFLFTLIILIWGLNWAVIKLIVLEITPLWSAAYRCIIAAVVLLVVQGATGNLKLPERRDVRFILLVGVFNIAITAACIAIGVQLVPVGRSVVLGYTTPLWVVPAARIFLNEAVPPRRIAGTAAGMVGIAILCGMPGEGTLDASVLAGYGIILLSALSWAIAIIGIRAHTWHTTPLQLLFWQLLVPSVLLSALAFAVEGPPVPPLDPTLLALLAYCGIPATALAYWVMLVINASLPATTTSLGVLATPVVGILGGCLVFGEGVDLPLAIASALILGGIAFGMIPPGYLRRRRSAGG
ncbi:MAG: DMT family transporter [Desulfovibrio sp.]|jgi:drug/metabolite transporter (DMT)-like permease|nr:DMT family transporter [Desulfovibrio sp.]